MYFVWGLLINNLIILIGKIQTPHRSISVRKGHTRAELIRVIRGSGLLGER